jgi:hypothetical protein
MKRFILTLTMVAAALVASVGLAGAASTWGNAQPITGFDAIGGTDSSIPNLIICSAPGNCTVLGGYNVAGFSHGFKAVEANGAWGPASVVPSLDTLSAGNDVSFETYGCAPQGSCIAAGSFGLGTVYSSFVYDLATGAAIEIPGLAALNTGNYSSVKSISCSSTGNCSLVGTFSDLSPYSQAFTADQVGGVWQNASTVAGATSGSSLQSVSCWADGECVAIGDVINGPISEPLLVTRSGGTWGNAATVPGISALTTANSGGNVVSCSAGPSCVAMGTSMSSGVLFVTTLVNGTWSNASQLPAFPELANSQYLGINVLSCWTPGNCLLSGSYTESGIPKVWLTEILDGVLQVAVPAPGFDALGTTASGVTAQSCASDGSCAVVGYYNDGIFVQGFVFNRSANGTFTNAQPIPGLIELNAGSYGDPQGASCVVGGCAATGYFRPEANAIGAFVVDMVTTPDPTPAPTPDPIAPAFTG